MPLLQKIHSLVYKNQKKKCNEWLWRRRGQVKNPRRYACIQELQLYGLAWEGAAPNLIKWRFLMQPYKTNSIAHYFVIRILSFFNTSLFLRSVLLSLCCYLLIRVYICHFPNPRNNKTRKNINLEIIIY